MATQPPRGPLNPVAGDPYQLYQRQIAPDEKGPPDPGRRPQSAFMDAYNQSLMGALRDWSTNANLASETPAPPGWKPSIPEGYGEYGEAFLDARNPAELNSIKMQTDRKLDGQRRRARDGILDTLGMDLLAGIATDPTNLVGMEVKGATWMARGLKGAAEQMGITAVSEGARLSLSPTANLAEAASAVVGAGVIGFPIGAVFGSRVGRSTVPRERLSRNTPSARSAEGMSSPLRGVRRVTSGFGRRKAPKTAKGLGSTVHDGVDFAGYEGEPIYAEADGVVTSKNVTSGGFGKHLTITYGDGTVVGGYGHLSQFAVETGDRVRKGDVIGYMGSTGKSTGVHLHQQRWVNGKLVDPLHDTAHTPFSNDKTPPHAGYAYSELGGVVVPTQVDFDGRGVNVTLGPKEGAPASFTRMKQGDEIADQVAREMMLADEPLTPQELVSEPLTDANSELRRAYAPNDPSAVDGWVTRRVPITEGERSTGMPGSNPNARRTPNTPGSAPTPPKNPSFELPEFAQRMNSAQLERYAAELERIVEDLRVMWRKGQRVISGKTAQNKTYRQSIESRGKYLSGMAAEARRQADWLDGSWEADPQIGYDPHNQLASQPNVWKPRERPAEAIDDTPDEGLAEIRQQEREQRSRDNSWWMADDTPYNAGATTADHNPYGEGIHLDVDRLAAEWRDKPWTRPTMEGVDPLPENAFPDVADYVQWTMWHELYHASVPKLASETAAQYENRINKLATEHMARETTSWAPSANRLQHLAIAPTPLGQAERALKDYPQLGFFKSIMGLSGDGALYTARNRVGAPTNPTGSVYQRTQMWFKHQYPIRRALQQGYANAVGRSLDGLDPLSATGVKLMTAIRQKLSRGYSIKDFNEDVLAHLVGLTDREFDEHVIKASGEITKVMEIFQQAENETNLLPGPKSLRKQADRMENMARQREARIKELEAEWNIEEATAPAGDYGIAGPPVRATPLVPAALAARTVPDALGYVAGSSIHDLHRQLAERLAGLTQDIPLHVFGDDAQDALIPGTSRRISEVHGSLSHLHGQAALSLNAGTGSRGNSEETLLHEALHGALATRIGALRKVPIGDVEALRGFGEDARSFHALAGFARDEFDKLDQAAKDALGWDNTDQMRIAFNNIDEFLTYATTNPAFKQWLDTIEMPAVNAQVGRLSVWQHIVNLAMKMFGVDPKYEVEFRRLLEPGTLGSQTTQATERLLTRLEQTPATPQVGRLRPTARVSNPVPIAIPRRPVIADAASEAAKRSRTVEGQGPVRSWQDVPPDMADDESWREVFPDTQRSPAWGDHPSDMTAEEEWQHYWGTGLPEDSYAGLAPGDVRIRQDYADKPGLENYYEFSYLAENGERVGGSYRLTGDVMDDFSITSDKGPQAIGPAKLRLMMTKLIEKNPDVKTMKALRVTGARNAGKPGIGERLVFTVKDGRLSLDKLAMKADLEPPPLRDDPGGYDPYYDDWELSNDIPADELDDEIDLGGADDVEFSRRTDRETGPTPQGRINLLGTLRRQADEYRQQAADLRAQANDPVLPKDEERYFPKHYDQSALEAKEALALERLEGAYAREGASDPAASAKAAYNLLTREPDGELGSMGSPMYLKMRKIPWTSAEAFPFMVKDIETITGIYNRRMSSQIEMARRYGDAFGLDELDRLEAEMVEAGVPHKTMVDMLQLWQDQRDHIAGQFHGRDPLSLRNRGVRALKNYGALTFFGKIIKSQQTDLARINMINGFGTRFWLGDKDAPAGFAQGVWALLAGHFRQGEFGLKPELKLSRQSGEAMELAHARLNARLMESDSALMVTRQTWLENVLAKAQLPYFVANLMIPFTIMAKDMASILTGHNIVNQSRLVARAVRAGQEPDLKMIQRLAGAGIDQIDAMIIADMPTEMTPGGLHLVNIDEWEKQPRGQRAADVMRAAVNGEVRRNVITPGPLDSPAAAHGVIHTRAGAEEGRARVSEARDLVDKRRAEYGEVWQLDDNHPERKAALENLQAAYGELEQARRAVGQAGRIEVPELQLPFQIKSFMFAAGGKLLHGLLSRPEHNRVMGMMGMFATSMAVTYWKNGGHIPDWAQFLVDSLDQMGVGGWLTEVGKTMDSLTNLGIFHEYDEEGNYYGDEVGAVAGPGIGSVFKTMEAAFNNEIPPEDRRRQLLGAIPGFNLIWLQSIIKGMKAGLEDMGVMEPGMGSSAPDVSPRQPQELVPELRGKNFITGDDPRFSKFKPLPATQVVPAYDDPNPPAPYARDVAKDKRVRRQQRIKARLDALSGYDPTKMLEDEIEGTSVH